MHTQIVHCLHEFQTGSHNGLQFTGQDYGAIYNEFLDLVEDVDKHPYHGPKLVTLLKMIAKEGR